MVNVAVISHYVVREKRRTGGDLLRFLVLPAIGIIINVILWIGIEPNAKLLGGVWLAIGLIYLAIISRGFRKIPKPIAEVEESTE